MIHFEVMVGADVELVDFYPKNCYIRGLKQVRVDIEKSACYSLFRNNRRERSENEWLLYSLYRRS